MSYTVSSVRLLTISPSLWLGAGENGKVGMWYDSQPQGKATQNILATLFKPAHPVISHPKLKLKLKTDDIAPDSTTPPDPLPAPAPRPPLARASTSATLINVDPVSAAAAALPPVVSHRVAEPRRTPRAAEQRTEVADRLRSCLLLPSCMPATPPVRVGDGHPDVDVDGVGAPPPKVRRARGKKKTARTTTTTTTTTKKKKTVRWSPEVIEREIEANRPVTGFERLERFRRLGLTV